MVCVLLVSFGFATTASAGDRSILLYGDSLLAGLGLDTGESFQTQLQAALDAAGIDARLVNASVAGDTTADGLERLEWTLGERPDAVILGLGANDMLRGLPADETRARLDAILTRLAASDLPVLLLGMKADRGLGADYVKVFDGLYPELAERYDVLFYPFYLQAVGLDPDFYQSDLRHPNGEGVRRIVADLLPKVKELLTRLR
ncbi:MAG: arylesterase [Devosia sp.]|nr:arylesterase [Devosia sp.]